MAMTYNGLFEKELKNIIETEIERVKDNMSTGSIMDYADYKHKIGIIYGLRLVVGYCDEVSAKIAKAT